MPAPTWNDTYQKWLAQHKAAFGGQDINRDWNRDADAQAQKMALDRQYLADLEAYAQQTGEAVTPDQSVLGLNVQPNTFTETDHSHDGFFGPVAKSLGMSTNDLGALAALAAGGYGLYSSGLLGGASAGGFGAGGASGTLGGAGAGAALTGGGLGAASAVGAGDLALASMPQAVTGAGFAGGGTLGAAGGTGLLSTLGGAASTAGKFLAENPTLAKLGGAALGALAGGDTTTSAQKDPWAPAQPYLLQNLKQNAGMQDYYAKNPFSTEQKAAYQGLLDTLANNQANAGNMQGIANSFMGSNRGLLANVPQFTQGVKAPTVDWSKYSNIGLMG